jgi:hypothetical protein
MVRKATGKDILMSAAALTAPAPAPTSTTASNADYRRDGVVIAPTGLPAPLVSDLRAHLARMIDGLAPGQRPEGLVEPHMRAADWQFWLEVCRHPQVLAAVSAAMGTDELLLVMSHLIVKPPRDGLAVAWHQDITYWPTVHGTEVSTVWLAIDDVDVGNACMHVIPRSHAERDRLEKIATDGTDLLKVRVHVTPEQEHDARPIELRAGEFSIHDSFAIHGSTVNTSERRRAGYTMRYADATRVQVDHAKHWVPIYYVAGDGRSLAPGMIDLSPGRPLPATPDARKAMEVPPPPLPQ